MTKKLPLLTLPCLFLSTYVTAEKKPDIILIMTDQHRWDALHCAGNNKIITPNIDRLAHEGHLFTSAYSSTPSSTPARAALLTGMSPWGHGMLGYGNVAKRYKYEMPRMLKQLGYYTFGIGKMHWHPQYHKHGMDGLLLDESGRVESDGFISDYRRWFQLQAPGLDPDETGIGWNDHSAGKYLLDEKLHPTFWTGETACQLINNYKLDKPLFLKISFARPHSPYDPPQRFIDLYDINDIQGPAVGDWSKQVGKDIRPEDDLDAPFGNFGADYVKNSKLHYYAAITFIDEQIGRIVSKLKETGRYENTMILLISDHGDMMGDHNHWRKTYAYEGSTAIPFIAKMPSSIKTVVRKGETIDQPVEIRDVLPTFITIGGGNVPTDMDGASITELLCSNTPQWREWIDLEHATCYTKENYWCALTNGDWKYVYFFVTGEEQLFRLSKDPLEEQDLARTKRHQKQLLKLRSKMAEHLEERGEDWVKDGVLQKRAKPRLYSPNYKAK